MLNCPHILVFPAHKNKWQNPMRLVKWYGWNNPQIGRGVGIGIRAFGGGTAGERAHLPGCQASAKGDTRRRSRIPRATGRARALTAPDAPRHERPAPRCGRSRRHVQHPPAQPENRAGSKRRGGRENKSLALGFLKRAPGGTGTPSRAGCGRKGCGCRGRRRSPSPSHPLCRIAAAGPSCRPWK